LAIPNATRPAAATEHAIDIHTTAKYGEPMTQLTAVVASIHSGWV
jgi:hypothetical protein